MAKTGGHAGRAVRSRRGKKQAAQDRAARAETFVPVQEEPTDAAGTDGAVPELNDTAHRELTPSDFMDCDLDGCIYRDFYEKGYDIELFSDWYQGFELSWYRTYDWDEAKALPMRGDDAGYDADAAEWIGFQYKQLRILSGMGGPEVAERMPFSTMLEAYGRFLDMAEREVGRMLVRLLGQGPDQTDAAGNAVE